MAINQEAHIHNLIICANVFIRKDGKWLVLKRSEFKKYAPGVCAPFGGKVDEREGVLTAAKREAFEETGLELDQFRLEAVVSEINPPTGQGLDWLIFHFSADYKSGELSTTEEGKAVLLNEDELISGDLFPSVKLIINHIVNPNDGVAFARAAYNEDGSLNEAQSHVVITGR